MFISKRFKIMEVVKICMPKKNGSKILLEMRFLSDPKNSKDENLKNK